MKSKTTKFIFSSLLTLSLLLGTLAVVMPASPVQAATINVPGDYTTIQGAIDAASNGDTINVAAGTYDVATLITVNKAVTIKGPDSGGAIVRGTTADDIRIFKIVTSDVTIKNLAITVASLGALNGSVSELDNSLVGISGSALSNISIKNNILYVPLQSGPMSGWNARAITAGDSSNANVIIRDNTIYNVRNGIVVRTGNTATVTNNIIFNTKGGIMNYTSNQGDANNRTVTGNSWASTVSGVISHNEWDIVWNTAYYVPDYQQSVVGMSSSNNVAYVLDRRAADPTACANLTGNRSHIFVDAASSFNTANPARGNFNEPFSSISLGVDAVVPGGTVNVAAGTYAEAITIGKANLTLHSESALGAIIRPTTTPGNGPWGTSGAAVYISADGVTVDGFEIDGTTVAKNGILGWETSGLTIKNNKIHGAVNAWDGCGILLFSWGTSGTVHNNLIQGNEVYDTGRMGIMVMDHGANYTVTSGNTITGNTVYDVWKKATAWNDGGGGIQINVGKNCSITNNEVYNVQDGQRGIYMFGSAAGNTIIHNTLRDNPIGIQLWISGEGGTTIDWGSDSPASPQVRYNNIYNNSSYGAKSANIAGTPMVMDAINNWWGANDGPGTVGPGSGDNVTANVDYDPWLVIGVSANPRSIAAGGVTTSTITADMTKNSAGNTSGGYVPNGTQITFTTNKGAIGSLTVDKPTTKGIATATLTSSNTVGTATVTASAPPHTVAATVSTSVNFVAGSSQQTGSATGSGTVTFAPAIGTMGAVTPIAEGTLPTAGKPAGVSFLHGLFSFNITNITPGSTVTVTITYPSAMPVGTQYWKCQNGTWINCTSLLGDDDGDNVLTLTLTDGGLGDADGVANGTIVDPGGPAVAVGAPAPSKPRASATPPHPILNPAQISTKYLKVSPQQTSAGQPVTISTNVVNGGDQAGNYNVALKINGQVEQQKMVSVGPRGTQPVKFTVTRAQPGTYAVDIGGQRSSFIILGAGGTTTAPLSGGIIAIIIVGVMVLVTVVLLMLSFRRHA